MGEKRLRKKSDISIGVVGLGYVGLPTALSFHESGFKVIGIDNSESVIRSLRSRVCHLRDDSVEWEIPENSVAWSVSDDFEDSIPRCDVVLITVPTPVNQDKTPDLSYVYSACQSVIKNLANGKRTVVVLQSTVFPGVTREVIGGYCESLGKEIGRDIVVAYSPERVDPGDSMKSVSGVAHIVGCDDSEEGRWLAWMFGEITTKGAFFVGSIEVAEASKLIENVQRDIDIAFVNELSITLPMMGVDVEEVLTAASTKWNFHRHSPGIGVGGHCIPVDPYYYINIAKTVGFPSRISEAARAINSGMPEHSANKIEEIFEDGLTGKRILILGYSYKPNVGDARETPVSNLIFQLGNRGCEVLIHDPIVDPRDFPESALIIDDCTECDGIDMVVLATSHRNFDNDEIEFWNMMKDKMDNAIVFDGRRSLSKEVFERNGWSYHGIGMPEN